MEWQFCPNCNKIISKYVEKCPNCGYKFNLLLEQTAVTTNKSKKAQIDKSDKRVKKKINKNPLIFFFIVFLFTFINVSSSVLSNLSESNSYLYEKPNLYTSTTNTNTKNNNDIDISSNTVVSVSEKEYINSYGLFSKYELYSMAKECLKDYAYPSYVYNFSSSSGIYIEKIDDYRLEYGSDSFSVVAYADFVINSQTYESVGFVVVIEPHTATTYIKKDVYVDL